MTKREILELLLPLGKEEQLQWMIDLGMQLTISARASYPFGESAGSVQHLAGFNEMQHQVYGRIRHIGSGDEWTLESFLDGLIQKGRYYEIEGDLGWALKASLRRFDRHDSIVQPTEE
jgi:hypothetical protein